MSEDSRNGRAAFRYPDYRLYVASRFIWTLGLQVMTVATAWFIYERTQDAFALGLIGLASFLPSIPLSLFTGPAADRYDRRLIVVGSCAIMSICALVILLLTHGDVVWPVYGAVIVLGSASWRTPAR